MMTKYKPSQQKTAQEPIPVAIAGRAVGRQLTRWFARAAHNPLFLKGYLGFSLVILLATTFVWAVLGTRLQMHNADQLSDPYLFSSLKVFHGAAFPGAHTQMLKWPIFWLVAAFGVSSDTIIAATVGLVMVTVIALALVLYKIDKRPLVFGTICLGLSLALLLVPAEPYAGALLPVNMAMLTTRNIEYVVYVLALVLFVRAGSIRTWNFTSGAVLLAMLIASDKLFLSLSLGGSLLALIVYSLLRAWSLVTFAARWLVGSIVAAAVATGIIAYMSAAHVTHIVDGGSANIYGFALGAKHLVLGATYAILALFTNVGANPVYDNLVVRRLPSSFAHSLGNWSAVAYGVAALALRYVILLAWRLMWRVPRNDLHTPLPSANKLAIALLSSTITALAVFVTTNHYYAVDARYLTIGFFALAVTASVGLRTNPLHRPERLLALGCVLVAVTAIALFTSVRTSDAQTAALSSLATRNSTVAATLQQHKTSLLVGDYWRIFPTKLAMQGDINTMPLSSCTQPVPALTSSAWQPNLQTTKFAYLLTLNGSVTNFPNCTIKEVVAKYGKPNATQVIAGSVAKPDEAILFYDRGSHHSQPANATAVATETTTILPISTDAILGANCMGQTTMNIVAHEDDDILFMNPDLLREVQSGNCVRTIYLTAGNAGQGELYWISRQLGAEAAYDSMLGKKNVWVQRTVQLAKNEYVTLANPRGNSKISLIFFNMPDGNIDGQGFPANKFESLAKLRSGSIAALHTVDDQSSYGKTQVVQALVQLMELYGPGRIQTQADITGGHFPDHSDHIATSKFAQAAAALYDQEDFAGQVTIPLVRYKGYSVQADAPNVSGGDLTQKSAAFFAYGRFDSDACNSIASCQMMSYRSYLARQYTEE